MKRTFVLAGALVLAAGFAAEAAAQSAASQDQVLQRIWAEGMENSQLYPLAHKLLDSLGPRLTGTPLKNAAHDWAASTFRSWGIEARNEQYGTWRGWRRGVTHIDLLEPRVRSLEGMMLAWSPATPGPVTGEVVTIPELADAEAFDRWLPGVRGRFVLMSASEPTCRAWDNWEQWATEESQARIRAERQSRHEAYNARIDGTGLQRNALMRRLEDAGAIGILVSGWQTGAWGTNRIFGAATQRVPTLDLSCEDYGLVWRLAEYGSRPVLRVNAESEFLGEMPTYNTIAEIRGQELPNEYVMLSAHFDSWDGASGATDNGTGTLVMMEAMRILQQVYPNPRRTILVGLWGGEEQGLNGSRAFVEDHPRIVENLHVLFNQDNGTGRIRNIGMQGFSNAEQYFRRWLGRVPDQLAGEINISAPGQPATGGTDHASFVCAGAPAFSLGATPWSYNPYTWHTNRDTFDKIVFDDLRNNATLVAMLVYLAAEDQRMPRDRVTLRNPQTGQERPWPACRPPQRSSPVAEN